MAYSCHPLIPHINQSTLLKSNFNQYLTLLAFLYTKSFSISVNTDRTMIGVRRRIATRNLDPGVPSQYRGLLMSHQVQSSTWMS
jgi:hypothetical protein